MDLSGLDYLANLSVMEALGLRTHSRFIRMHEVATPLCGVTCNAEPKNWMNDTAPACPRRIPCLRARQH